MDYHWISIQCRDGAGFYWRFSAGEAAVAITLVKQISLGGSEEELGDHSGVFQSTVRIANGLTG
jgi:hypothetical protein